jgi:hypothetical protein
MMDKVQEKKIVSICYIPPLKPHSVKLTFKNRASYIEDGRTPNLQKLNFIYLFSTNISTEYFKHAAHSPFFSSKCHLFYNAIFFGFCIIYIFTYRIC